MFKYVIFDMDGVIFDSERLYIECDKEVALKYGIEDMDFVEEVCRKCIGVTSEGTLRIMKENFGENIPIDEMLKDSAALFKERSIGGQLPVKPGVNELLEYLKGKGIHTAIASSTKSDIVKRELNDAGLLGYFDEVVGGDMIEKSKPAPDSFLKAMEVLECGPEDCCIIEDSFNGIRAANASGGFPIMVPDILQPDEEIRSLAGVVMGSLFDVKEYFISLEEKESKSKDGIKLFATDLDGTILTEKKEISPRTKEALIHFVEAGNHFAICTGRDITSGKLVYNELKLEMPGSYVMAYNGGMIYDVDEDRVIYRVGIEKELVKEIFEMAADFGIYIQTYNDDFILSPWGGECLDYYKKVIKTPAKVGEDALDYMDKPPCKIICIELHDHEKQERFRKAVTEKYGDKLDLMYSSPVYLELIPKNSGKGEALRYLADHLDIPIENTIAAGDGENDISMIEAAGLGIAMKNAPDVVKAAADVVTEFDNDHDGLAGFIR